MFTRRDLLRLMAAAGALAPLGAGPRLAGADDGDGDGGDAGGAVDKGYLVRGLHALARAHRARWSDGHHGCAVIAGYYFCRENGLDAATRRAVASHLDRFMVRRKRFFEGDPPGGEGGARVDPILEALGDTVGRLRSGGHDAIYGSLALRALRDAPEAASAEVVEGVRLLLRKFERDVKVEEPGEHHRRHPMEPYGGDDHIVAATFDAVLRPWSHFVAGTKTGKGNVVHWITHADALVTLRELGHEELAGKAGAAHQQYINHPVIDDGAGEPAAAPEPPAGSDWRTAAHWESDRPRTPQKGSWFFGHSFKLPYSLMRLARHAEAGRAAKVIERASLLPEDFR